MLLFTVFFPPAGTGKSFLTGAGGCDVRGLHPLSANMSEQRSRMLALFSACWLTTVYLWCIVNGKSTKAAAPTGTGLCEKVTARKYKSNHVGRFFK